MKSAKAQSHKWLERVGLAGFEEHFPVQLSGGMQQRVGLARALATDAEILLMDEAFSALDPLIRTDMQDVLLDLQRELRELHKTIVFITHDLDEALRIGDKIAILRDGELIQQGDPQQLIINPADDYIFDFVKDINRGRVLQVRVLSKVLKSLVIWFWKMLYRRSQLPNPGQPMYWVKVSTSLVVSRWIRSVWKSVSIDGSLVG